MEHLYFVISPPDSVVHQIWESLSYMLPILSLTDESGVSKKEIDPASPLRKKKNPPVH